MKRIAVASGKGGTGKTFVASSLTYYLGRELGKSVLGIDCDVEEPDLATPLGELRKIFVRREVWDSRKVRVVTEKCVRCLRCREVCYFGAVELREDGYPVVIPELCEGCLACTLVCPTSALEVYTARTGVLELGETRCGIPLAQGHLEVGERSSGKLVYLVRQLGDEVSTEYQVLDAPAGTGCPVISALVGVDELILVTEPTVPALQGLTRVWEVAKVLKIEKVHVILNRYGVGLDLSTVRRYLSEYGLEVDLTIPYSRAVVEAYSRLMTVLEYEPYSDLSRRLRDFFTTLSTVR